MLATVTIRQEALPVVRSSIALKRQALGLNLRSYQARLKEFEKRHRMTTEQFAARFDAGSITRARYTVRNEVSHGER